MEQKLNLAWAILVGVLIGTTVSALLNGGHVGINEVTAMTKIASQEFFKGHAVYWIP